MYQVEWITQALFLTISLWFEYSTIIVFKEEKKKKKGGGYGELPDKI